MYERSRLEPESKRQLLFEWAYPDIARQLAEEGAPYPDLDEKGAIRD